MPDTYTAVAETLFEIERQLRWLELWESEAPAPSDLASTQPFAVDTLHFPQWLQFIFIPRLYQLVEYRAPLPETCSVAPMAEEYFKPLPLDSVELIAQLREVDALITDS